MFLVYADKEEKKKAGIFDRLEISKSELSASQPKIKVTGLNKMPSSIFARLGGKSSADDIELDESVAVSFAGILKSAPKKVSTIIFGSSTYRLILITLLITDGQHKETAETPTKSDVS